ncbi:MAG: signal peptidase I [Treponema sp.]|nr:signal peptidase I [Treponema sp.]
MRKLKFFIYINLALAAVFSFLCVSFHRDISVLAFPLAILFTAALFYVTVILLLRKKEFRHLGMVRRFFQYEPFVFISAFVIQRAGEKGCPYPLDLAAALVWVAIMILSFVILFFLSEKRFGKVCPEWAAYMEEHPKKVYHGIKRVGIEAAEWVDALVQAVFTIVLLNIFVFQLYEIPSESMVSTFLIGDRVAVGKTLSGPKFPLSDVGLPYIQNYDRGDIVVFRNPHYSDDRKNEVKTFMSQFVYMLTLTFVKTNTDEYGNQKADPLVKRVVGLPGEQLMLMDGNLYARTANSEFRQISSDNGWAVWNLNALPAATKQKVKYFPISQEAYNDTLQVEEERRNLDLESAKLECMSLSNRFAKVAMGAEGASGENFISTDDLMVYGLQSLSSRTISRLLTMDGGADWFNHFMNDWYSGLGDLNRYTEKGSVVGSSLVGGDLYTDSRFRLNLMFKLTLGRIMVRSGELLSNNADGLQLSSDTYLDEQVEVLKRLVNYVVRMDQRNMGLFPANDSSGNPSYIPENCYFMMGDNRYNSSDMRHSYEQTLEPLYSGDKYSVTYYTNLAPQYVNRSKILGKASLRIWPLSRFGSPGKKNN